MSDSIFNPATGRYVQRTGKIGKKLVEISKHIPTGEILTTKKVQDIIQFAKFNVYNDGVKYTEWLWGSRNTEHIHIRFKIIPTRAVHELEILSFSASNEHSSAIFYTHSGPQLLTKFLSHTILYDVLVKAYEYYLNNSELTQTWSKQNITDMMELIAVSQKRDKMELKPWIAELNRLANQQGIHLEKLPKEIRQNILQRLTTPQRIVMKAVSRTINKDISPPSPKSCTKRLQYDTLKTGEPFKEKFRVYIKQLEKSLQQFWIKNNLIPKSKPEIFSYKEDPNEIRFGISFGWAEDKKNFSFDKHANNTITLKKIYMSEMQYPKIVEVVEATRRKYGITYENTKPYNTLFNMSRADDPVQMIVKYDFCD